MEEIGHNFIKDLQKFKEKIEETLIRTPRVHASGKIDFWINFFLGFAMSVQNSQLGQENLKIKDVIYKVDLLSKTTKDTDPAKVIKLAFKLETDREDIAILRSVIVSNNNDKTYQRAKFSKKELLDIKADFNMDSLSIENTDPKLIKLNIVDGTCAVEDNKAKGLQSSSGIFRKINILQNENETVLWLDNILDLLLNPENSNKDNIKNVFNNLIKLYSINDLNNLYKSEAAPHGFIYGLFILNYKIKYNLDIDVERNAGRGCLDLSLLFKSSNSKKIPIKNPGYIVVEFKSKDGVNESSDAAIRQIKDKGYIYNLVSRTTEKIVTLVGINFNRNNENERLTIDDNVFITYANSLIKFIGDASSISKESIKEHLQDLYASMRSEESLHLVLLGDLFAQNNISEKKLYIIDNKNLPLDQLDKVPKSITILYFKKANGKYVILTITEGDQDIEYEKRRGEDRVRTRKQYNANPNPKTTLKKQQREGCTPFVFFEGPPSANGAPGVHHLLAMTVKDLFTRYKTMKGYYVRRKSGWDTHGLPVELQVEKKLAITKEDIGKKISIVDYNQECRTMVMSYKKDWETINKRLGYWKDNLNPYLTYTNDYIESVWYLLKALYNKDLLYKGYSIQPYSPTTGTGLSSHELNQPGCYQLVNDLAIVAQFKRLGQENEYLLAWTTTPWTLPANSALAVGATIHYVKVSTINPYTRLPIYVILAEDAVKRFFTQASDLGHASDHRSAALPWEIVARYTGVDLIGWRYEPLLPYISPQGNAFKVIAADFVTTTEGTGIVHIAPTFGADDYRIAQQENIAAIMATNAAGELVPIVDRQGRFVPAITDFAGRYVKAAYEEDSTLPSVDLLIADKLKKEHKAFQVAQYAHSYPHCWRTHKPILYYPLEAWFIKTTAYKELLIELNDSIQWKPDAVGKGRFGNWLEHLVDWNLSRERYWGIPLPIWRTADQKEEKCISSIAELRFEVEQAVWAGHMQEPLPAAIDLHRPYVDAIVLVSSRGLPMYRESAVIDVWFDSGAMPCAQWHYPFENQERFEEGFPADFIAEGIDQTRGWFFTLHVISTLLFEIPAFKNVVVNGLVLDKHGNKMSKSMGNTLDPMELLTQYGPDAIRWYMISNANPWDNLKFDSAGVAQVARKFFITLNNTYNFFALYANLDQFYVNKNVGSDLNESDQWITSRAHTLIQAVTKAYDHYEPTLVARMIQDFVIDDLSNWYVRLNRKRFWKNSQDRDKEAAYQTLYQCLITVAKLMAPIAPFYADYLYQALNSVTKKETHPSVHLSDFPKVATEALNPILETDMGQVQTIVALAHALRKKHKIKVRQPLASIRIAGLVASTGWSRLEALIQTEINVKQVHYLDAAHNLKKAKPNFPLLGKRYGSKMKFLHEAIVALTPAEIYALEQGNTHVLHLQDEVILLHLADILIVTEAMPGWCVATEGPITVALDTTLDDALRAEGGAREFVHHMQQLRKALNFDVQDKISIDIEKDQNFIAQAIATYTDYICAETQAMHLQFFPELERGTPVHIAGVRVVVRLTKVA